MLGNYAMRVMPYGWFYSPFIWLQFAFAEGLTLALLLRSGLRFITSPEGPALAKTLLRDNAWYFCL